MQLKYSYRAEDVADERKRSGDGSLNIQPDKAVQTDLGLEPEVHLF